MTASPSAAPRLLESPGCVWDARAALGEGTWWSVREEALWWVDILGGELHRHAPVTGQQRSWRFEGETISAVAERETGPGLVVTLRRSFAWFDPETGELRRLPESEPDRPKNRFNDGKCDARGRFWAGTMDFDAKAPTGALWRIEGGGAGSGPRIERVLDARFAVTNGPAWSHDGRTMWFSDTVRGTVHAYPFDPEAGTLGEPRVFLHLGGKQGHPDGMTTDAAGRLWIAHWGASCVTCHDPVSGAELLRVSLPATQVSNVAFGGAALDTLYVTTARQGLDAAALGHQPLAGGLFAVRTDAKGLAPDRFAG
jgi:sugar lactone lactonase YvrE